MMFMCVIKLTLTQQSKSYFTLNHMDCMLLCELDIGSRGSLYGGMVLLRVDLLTSIK